MRSLTPAQDGDPSKVDAFNQMIRDRRNRADDPVYLRPKERASAQFLVFLGSSLGAPFLRCEWALFVRDPRIGRVDAQRGCQRD